MNPGTPDMHALEHDSLYPDSDGKPMADNTLQFDWIVRIKENLDHLLPDFVGGDLLWYAVEGEPGIRVAPDVLVALGRPKGYRGSYKTWCEDGVVPQVVFEVLSPGNTLGEMQRKLLFYQRHGVSEYYVLDPDAGLWNGYVRHDGAFMSIDFIHRHVSPHLGIRFEHDEDGARLYRPDGEVFSNFGETRAELDGARVELEALRAKLREAGIEP